MDNHINILNAINTMRGKNIFGVTLTRIVEDTRMWNLNPTLTRYMVGSTTSGDALIWHIDHTGEVQKGYTATIEMGDGTLYTRHLSSVTALLKGAGLLDIDYEPRPTLFGQHLLYGNKKPAHILTDEMTALYMATMDSNAVYLAGTPDEIPDNAAAIMRNRCVTLHGFPDDAAKKFEGMKVRMCEPLTIEVRPHEEKVRARWEKNEKELTELAEKVDALRKSLMEAAHKHYMETNESYRAMVDKLKLAIVG